MSRRGVAVALAVAAILLSVSVLVRAGPGERVPPAFVLIVAAALGGAAVALAVSSPRDRAAPAAADPQVSDRYRAILHASQDGFWLVDLDGRILEVNEAACRATGYTAEELRKMHVWEIDALESAEETGRHVQRIASRGTEIFETRHRRKDGTLMDVEVSVFHAPSERVTAAFIRDVTARKRAEEKIRNLSVLYRALSECNKSVIAAASPGQLYEEICRIIVDHGGMKIATVGLLDARARCLRPVARYGGSLEEIAGLTISLDPEVPEGRCPAAVCVRDGLPVWSRDPALDGCVDCLDAKVTDPDRVSVAAVPIRHSGRTAGCLTLFSDRIGAFDSEVRKLILEIGATIGFALDRFTQEEERRKAEAEITILKAAIEQSANMILITDARGVIEYVNPAFTRTTGYAVEEVRGRTPSLLSSGRQGPEFYRDLWSRISSGQTWCGEFQNRRKDGTIFWEAAMISPVRGADGQIEHFIAVKEDITARKSLEDDVREALGRAEAASRAKSEFLAVMSHELRTPLNGVLGFADLLAATPLGDDQAEYVRTIHESGSHLLGLVNDILDFSSIEKGVIRLVPESFPLRDLLDCACQAVHKMVADKGLTCRCTWDENLPARIVGDERRIRQVLLNLLGNSVKFTTAGEVCLAVRLAGDAVRPVLAFSVADTGPGIDPETMRHLFEPFVQADSSLHRRHEGTGLGLAISKRLVEAMGGEISVSSTPGQGTEFRFWLPLAVAPVPLPERSPGDAFVPPEMANQRILVVEDDRINRALAGRLLSALGQQVDFAANGEEAVRMATSGVMYQAILMDLQMPVMDGLEAARRIRAWERESGHHTPIIALTANVMPGDRAGCLAAGMDDFLSKPFRKDELVEHLSPEHLSRFTRGAGTASGVC